MDTSDRLVAEAELVPALIGAGARITELRPEQRSLEDIYLEITADDGPEENADDD